MNAARAAALAAALLAGCALLEEQPPAPVKGEPAARPAPSPPAVPALVRSVADLLEYYDALRRTDAASRAREHERAKQAYNPQQGAYARVRLALFGVLPGADPEQQSQALALLEPVARDERPQDRDLQRFAALLYAGIQEQRRAAEGAAGAAQRAREEARRADDLQQKLDALKSIEKSLIERDQLRKGQ
jgi:hypothetical protein